MMQHPILAGLPVLIAWAATALAGVLGRIGACGTRDLRPSRSASPAAIIWRGSAAMLGIHAVQTLLIIC